MTKFNYKIYQNKDRVYSELKNYTGISKLWIWNNEFNEYRPPQKGKAYQVRKRILKFGKSQRITKFFDSLEEARQWQIQTDIFNSVVEGKAPTITFKDILKSWEIRVLTKLKESTQVGYQKIISKYFTPLLDVEMKDFNSKVVDDWIDFLLEGPRTHRRTSFIHELDLLSVILNFHREYSDDFYSPIKRRHRKAIQIKESGFRGKDLSEDEFFKFRKELLKLRDGELYAIMATVQFFQALRVSEVAAIHWEDIVLNDINPVESRIVISRSIKWIRKAGAIPRLENNFKNSKANGGLKEQPLFEETYNSLRKYVAKTSAMGMIFTVRGNILTYRQIQNAYDSAFKAAQLPFSGTHVMRHGGCRRVFNKNGDIGLAQQVLGNRDMRSVMVYAQRNTNALNEFAKKEWSKESGVAANGCNAFDESKNINNINNLK